MGEVAYYFWQVVIAYVVLRVIVRTYQLGHFPEYVDRHRRFSKPQYHQIMRRAGYRCEHYRWPFGRCKAKMPLEADHIHPWAKGGQTAIENGQALCQFHNSLKWAWVPTMVSVWRLEQRRLKYFPHGTEVGVERYGDQSSLRRRGKGRRRKRRSLY